MTNEQYETFEGMEKNNEPVFDQMEPKEYTYSFSAAFELVKVGRRFQRKNWNGKGQYIEARYPKKGEEIELPYLILHTAQGKVAFWVPSISDLFASDWVEV